MSNKITCSAIGCNSTEIDWYTINGSSSLVNLKTPICKDHVSLAKEDGWI